MSKKKESKNACRSKSKSVHQKTSDFSLQDATNVCASQNQATENYSLLSIQENYSDISCSHNFVFCMNTPIRMKPNKTQLLS